MLQRTQACRQWVCRISSPWQLWRVEMATFKCHQTVSREYFERYTIRKHVIVALTCDCKFQAELSGASNYIRNFGPRFTPSANCIKHPYAYASCTLLASWTVNPLLHSRTLMIACVVEVPGERVNCLRFCGYAWKTSQSRVAIMATVIMRRHDYTCSRKVY